MTSQEIKALPIEEKLRIGEAIWEDMRDRFDNAPISESTLDMLRQRQQRVANGEAGLLEL